MIKQKTVRGWTSPLGIAVAVISIVGSLYAGATWAFAQIAAPSEVLKPRIIALEVQTNLFLQKQDFKEFLQIYWQGRKDDAISRESLAISIGKFQTSLEDIKVQQADTRDDIKALRH